MASKITIDFDQFEKKFSEFFQVIEKHLKFRDTEIAIKIRVQDNSCLELENSTYPLTSRVKEVHVDYQTN